MSADLRGFVYGLEPVRTKAQWRLEALQRDLARATARSAELHGQTEAVTRDLEALTVQARSAAASLIDPTAALQRLTHMASISQRLTALSAERDAADAAKADCLEQVRKQQLAIEALEKDRERHQHDYVTERQRRSAVEADDDWLTRTAWSVTMNLEAS